MYKASAGVTLPTSIIGSLPRPSWYSAGLGSQSFLEAMMNLRYREQYEDAVSVYLRAQATARLDICTDGDAHFDEQISGMSWQSYPLAHMAGFSATAGPSAYQIASSAPRGHILHASLDARVLPKIVGPVGLGNLRYSALWKVAQRLTQQPVKFGTVLPEFPAASVDDEYYKDPVERVLGNHRRAQQRARRLGRWRLPGDPAGGAADPYEGIAFLRARATETGLTLVSSAAMCFAAPRGEKRSIPTAIIILTIWCYFRYHL